LPNREEIEGALKYLKNNKAVSSDSISAKLLKNSDPNMVDFLHEMIRQAWTSEAIPEDWTKSIVNCVHCLRKRINSIAQTIEAYMPAECCIQSLRQNFTRKPADLRFSTLLFNVVFEIIVRRAKLQTRGTISKHYLKLEREANKLGLKINESKTKYMIAAGNDRTIRDVGQSMAFGEKIFEVMKNLCIWDPW
jgi:hypothetical protein